MKAGEAWTDERIEAVARMWQHDGLSATQIAAALGAPHVTRNAVIGIIHRRKLSGKGKRPHNAPRRMTKVHHRKRQPRPRKVNWSVKPVGESRSPVPVVPTKVEVPEPVSKQLPLLKLKSGKCKWPSEKAPFTFCGAPALKVEEVSGPYCAHHKKRAYQPASTRRIRVPA